MEILEAVQQAGHKADPLTHTKRPIVTGTSVLGIQYKDGVMLAADTLGSYGSLARFKDLRRIRKVGARTLVGTDRRAHLRTRLAHSRSDRGGPDQRQHRGRACPVGPRHAPRRRGLLYERRRRKL